MLDRALGETSETATALSRRQ